MRTDTALWAAIKAAYEQIVARRPDSDFYRTFFNSVTRDTFGTVGVNREVEFCATNVGRTSGSVPIRVYRVGATLPVAVRELLADLPFTAFIADVNAAVHRISAEIGRYFETHRQNAAPESIELIEPLFYRGSRAFLVGRLIDDTSMAPLVIAFDNSSAGRARRAVMLSRADVGSCSGSRARTFTSICRSSARQSPGCDPSCRASRSTNSIRCWAAPSRERRSATSRCAATSTRRSTRFVHAPGERGLVMIVFTLPSHDLVFKVIRDRFGEPKRSTRADVIERYQFVFRHDRAGRLVDAQEFKRLRLPRARFMPQLVEELLTEASRAAGSKARI
jgi:isocitrate dehydrogenase kinase/phosphatase